MTKKKKTILITAISAAVLAVCGCIGIYRHVSRFDASDYVRAVLDASYKNETDLYVEITGIPEEEAWILRWRDSGVRICRRKCCPGTGSFSERSRKR